MNTQEESGISIVYRHDQQGYRMLELPPELQEIFSADPTASITIKSTLPSTENTGNSSSSHAVLCTNKQTFQLRQVQSSNSILLLKPSYDPSTTDKPALSVIACPKSTLELQQTAASALPYLLKALVTYHGPQDVPDDFESMDASSLREKKTKERVFEDVPASKGECEQAWTALCAFEYQGVAYRPSAQALVGVWKVIHTAAASEGINLCNQLDLETLWGAMEEDGYPRALVESVLVKLSAENSGNSTLSIDQSKCVPWVAVAMLQSRPSSQPPADITRFLSEWRELIPESWRSLADLNSIKGLYYKPTPTTIKFQESETASSMKGIGSTTSSNAKSSPAGRKWHEKFRNAARR